MSRFLQTETSSSEPPDAFEVVRRARQTPPQTPRDVPLFRGAAEPAKQTEICKTMQHFICKRDKTHWPVFLYKHVNMVLGWWATLPEQERGRAWRIFELEAYPALCMSRGQLAEALAMCGWQRIDLKHPGRQIHGWVHPDYFMAHVIARA